MYYVITLAIYAAVDAIACLGLSQQFGVGGVTNFGFIIFQSAGAYAAAILALPPDTANGGFQSYIGGLGLPFPLPWLGAAAAGAVLALPFTFLVGRRLRGDFAAIGLLVTAVLANLLAMNYRPLFNGDAGVAVVPAPNNSGQVFVTSTSRYQWAFVIGSLALAALVYWLVAHLTETPYGRTLRAMRDNDKVAESLGKNLFSLRTAMLVFGGAIAGLSGGILVSFISVWSPAAWTYAETIVLFAAVIIGGSGNHRGAILGAILVPVGFEEVTRLISDNNPNLPPNLLPSLQWVAIGLLIAVFLWFRPQGVLPERKRVIKLQPVAADGPGDQPPAAWVPRQPAPPGGGKDLLVVAGLTRDFGGVHAVSGASFSVREGTLTGLIGPNGAGKSTLLAMVAGTEPSDGGQISYNGTDVTAMPAFRRSRSGLVRTFQLASEFKRLTVLENLLVAAPGNRGDSFGGAMLGRWYWRSDEQTAIERAEAVLRRFGLEALANEYAGDLSGGQRRLVELMRALMTEPKLLLLDEPMAGVHPELARKIGTALVGLCREGMTILMVEHELSIMDEFCDPVIVMADGAVLAQGTMAELRERAEVVEAYLVG
jgi:ABC-type branched-subunit amino acid transport system ATPase component/ABC-type branched-subunit amino acid transport system permease subunit